MTSSISCIVPQCQSTIKNCPKGLSFYRFPSAKERRDVWLALCGRHDLLSDSDPNPTKLVICSNHFEEDQFAAGTNVNKRLVEDAVPTIFPFAASLQDNPSPRQQSIDGEEDEQIAEFDPDLHTEVKIVDVNTEDDIELIEEESQPTPAPTTSKPAAQQSTLMAIPSKVYQQALKSGGTISLPSTSGGAPQAIVLNMGEKRKLGEGDKLEGVKKFIASLQHSSKVGPTRVQQDSSGNSPLLIKENSPGSYIILSQSGLSQLVSMPGPTILPKVVMSNPQQIIQTVSSSPPPLISTSAPVIISTTAPAKPATTVSAPSATIPDLNTALAIPVVNAKSTKKTQKPQPSTSPSDAGPRQLAPFQAAPKLPIPALKSPPNFNWASLRPKPWQDWPVPAEVFMPALEQLKANYDKLFTRGDRMDIETTLHLAAHYNVLCSESKAHLRMRVHHLLKLMQIEQEKIRNRNAPKNNNKENGTPNTAAQPSAAVVVTVEEQPADSED